MYPKNTLLLFSTEAQLNGAALSQIPLHQPTNPMTAPNTALSAARPILQVERQTDKVCFGEHII